MGVAKRLESLVGYDPDLDRALKRNKAIIKEIYRKADFILGDSHKMTLETNYGSTVTLKKNAYPKSKWYCLWASAEDQLRGSILVGYGGKKPAQSIDMHIFKSGKIASSSYSAYLRAVKTGAGVEAALNDIRYILENAYTAHLSNRYHSSHVLE